MVIDIQSDVSISVIDDIHRQVNLDVPSFANGEAVTIAELIIGSEFVPLQFVYNDLGDSVQGTTPDNPVLPPTIVPPACGTVAARGFCWDHPHGRLWYDPPLADGFTYSLSSGNFTEVAPPPASFGFGPVDLMVGGIDEGYLDPGETFDFLAHGLTDVSTFSLLDINPLLDTASPSFSSAFPTFLDFTGSPDTLTMTPIVSSTVPEPASLTLLGTGLIGFGLWRRRSRRGSKSCILITPSGRYNTRQACVWTR